LRELCERNHRTFCGGSTRNPDLYPSDLLTNKVASLYITGALSTLPLSILPPTTAAALTTSIPFRSSNDRHDAYDPVTPTTVHNKQHLLPRTHIAAVSAGIFPPSRVRFREQERHTHLLDEDNLISSPLPSDLPAPSNHKAELSYPTPHSALRISRNTKAAILWTLEAALRQPHPFTSDLIEETASMSDFMTGGLPSNSGRNGGSRAQGATGSPNIKGPRDIMRERNAREARRKAEQEALERQNAEEEARLIEEERKRTAERKGAAAGAAPVSAPSRGREEAPQRVSDPAQRAERRQERTSGGATSARPADSNLQGRGTGGRAVGGGETPANTRRRPSQLQQAPQPVPAGPSAAPQPPQMQPGLSAPTGPSAGIPAQGQSAPASAARSSFPHAFERWETLSAHWEGLTSFWIRRLEENANETNRDPLSSQLARQVTDLSAAGANLFHAVVELQRLRASSERKFQRWFFDTRAEQERASELQAITETALREERLVREELIAKAVRNAVEEQANVQQPQPEMEKRLAEMKRELEISKQEARRAWDELGRREAEERARTLSLRDGQPTLVGGVQVVPMMQGVPGRHNSGREPAVQQPTTGAGVQDVDYGEVPQHEGPDLSEAYQQYQAQRTDTSDPFIEHGGVAQAAEGRHRTQGRERAGSRSTPTTQATNSPPFTPGAPAVQPTSIASYQQQQGTHLHPTEAVRTSGEGYSDDEYEIDPQGQFRRDSRGNRIRYHAPPSDDESDSESVAAAREREMAYLQRYGQPVASSSGVEYARAEPTSHLATTTSGGRTGGVTHAEEQDEPDYEGQGYGSGPGWEAVPRHHHPTRLSDVLEEDERSRTSAGQGAGGAGRP